MSQSLQCPVCLQPATMLDATHEDKVDGRRCYQCKFCGCYRATFDRGDGVALVESVDRRRRGLLRGVLHAFAGAHPGHFFETTIDPSTIDNTLRAHAAPRTHNEAVDVILRKIAALAPRFGEWTEPEDGQEWCARAYLLENREWDAIETAYRDLFAGERRGPGLDLRMQLLRKGWDRLNEIEHTRREPLSMFVATWAHREIADVFKQATVEAAKELGLSVEIGIELGDAGLIDDSIAAAIRRARVVVADLTGHRGGVYYEAGFAHGLGIPVVFTCHQDWKRRSWTAEPHHAEQNAESDELSRWWDGVHFDVDHYPRIPWTTANDVRRRIVDRVRAIGLAAPGHE